MTAALSATRGRLRRIISTDVGRLVLVSAVCVGLPLVFTLATGALEHPHNDDWAFFRILFNYADTGRVDLVGWNEMMLIGHLAAALPVVKLFGHDVTAVNTFEAVVAGIGLFSLGLVARRLLPPKHALLVVLIVGIFPPFAALVPTFMTDNASFATQVMCIAIGVAGIAARGAERHYLVWSSLVVGVLSFSIREFGLIAPLAVVIGYALAQRRSRQSLVWPLLGLAAVVAAAAGLYAMRHGVPGDGPHPTSGPGLTALLVTVSQALFGLSLAVSPALLVGLRGRVKLGPYVAAASIGATMLGLFAIQRSAFTPTCCLGSQGSVFLGNLVTERGPLGNQVLFGERPVLFPSPLWIFLSAAAMGAAAALVVLAIRGVMKIEPRALLADPVAVTVACFGLGAVAALGVRAKLGGAFVDRYLIVPIAVSAIFLLRGRPEPRSRAEARGPLAALVALALVGAIVVTSGAAFDGARWQGGEVAVAAGIPAGDVDAGFEWVGFHYPGLTSEPLPRRSAATPPGYMDMFPRAGNCGLLAASPQTGPDFIPLGQVAYRQFLGLSTQHLYVYRYVPGCAAAGLPAE